MAERILSDLECHDKELSILLVDNDTITDLNRKYLSRDYPTNVLAFPMDKGEGRELHPYLMGDVVISTETAQVEAQDRGITLKEEMALLLVHGILHLLGYDHEGAPDEAAKMLAKEKGVLIRLGIVENHQKGL